MRARQSARLPCSTFSSVSFQIFCFPHFLINIYFQGANYLDIPGLIEIISQKIANMATGKTVEELREVYCLENDFTPEEEAELKKRFEWIEA